MAIESDADRLDYLTAFGESHAFQITSTMANWDAYGVFDNEFIDVEGVESRQPVLMCRYTDIYDPDGTVGDIADRATAVNVSGENGYNIVEVRDDGVGMVALILELQ